MQAVKCYLCEKFCSTVVRPLLELKDSGHDLYISICERCGLIFQSPRWSKERFDDFYKSIFNPLELPPPARHIQKGRYVWDRIDGYLKGQVIEQVLDVGGGTGYIQQECLTRYENTKLYAIEPSDQCREWVTQTYGTTIVANYVEESWSPKYTEFFDVIIMRHVLEHILEPINALGTIRNALKPSGLLYIAVPNTMFARNFIQEGGAFNIPHVYYFNMPTLMATVQQAGYAIVGHGVHNSEIWVVVRKGHFLEKSLALNNYKRQKKFIDKVISVQLHGKDPSTLNMPLLKRFVRMVVSKLGLKRQIRKYILK